LFVLVLEIGRPMTSRHKSPPKRAKFENSVFGLSIRVTGLPEKKTAQRGEKAKTENEF